jgi:hypothetical protein
MEKLIPRTAHEAVCRVMYTWRFTSQSMGLLIIDREFRFKVEGGEYCGGLFH